MYINAYSDFGRNKQPMYIFSISTGRTWAINKINVAFGTGRQQIIATSLLYCSMKHRRTQQILCILISISDCDLLFTLLLHDFCYKVMKKNQIIVCKNRDVGFSVFHCSHNFSMNVFYYRIKEHLFVYLQSLYDKYLTRVCHTTLFINFCTSLVMPQP